MSKEAMKLALEALKQIDEAMPFPVAKLAQAVLREALAEQPAQQEQGDSICQEDDGCPTELAVLQRFWRGQSISYEHYPTWCKPAPVPEPCKHEPVDSEEKAGAYMEARLWEFIDMAAAWPKASPDPRTWDHVVVYAPKPAQQCQYPKCSYPYPDLPDCRDADQPAQQEPIHVPVTDNTYGYAKSLAEAIFKKHFAGDEHYASGRVVWGVNDTVIGILTQIDNMVADMVRRSEQPAQQELVAIERLMRGQAILQWNRAQAEPPITVTKELWVAEQLEQFYIRPQAREWVGLTDEDKHYLNEVLNLQGRFPIIDAIEAKLKAKNFA